MSDCQAPYIDSAGCMVTPACPGQPYIPATVTQQPVLGWNAGANSVAVLDGDLHAVFAMPAGTVGAVVGLKAGRARPTVPDLVTHGLFFQSLAGVDMVQVVESGAPQGAAAMRNATDTFELRRVAGVVTYWQNGTLLRTSMRPSAGVVLVNACLYASGDEVPSGA